MRSSFIAFHLLFTFSTMSISIHNLRYYSSNTHDFHVVYEGVSMGPSVGGLAGKRFDVDLLGCIQIVQCFRK